MSDATLRELLVLSVVRQLAIRSPCTEQQAEAVVAAFDGQLDYLTMYGGLRLKGHTHDKALEFLTHDYEHDKKENHFLACLSEECGEVVQLVGKSQRFGSMDYHPKTEEQNFYAIQREMHDVMGVYQLLCRHMGEPCKFDAALLRAKRHKTIRLMKEHGVIK